MLPSPQTMFSVAFPKVMKSQPFKVAWIGQVQLLAFMLAYGDQVLILRTPQPRSISMAGAAKLLMVFLGIWARFIITTQVLMILKIMITGNWRQLSDMISILCKQQHP